MKRFATLVSILALAGSLALSSIVSANRVLRGDANGDTEVDMGDVIKQERCILELDTDCDLGADADADGDVDMGDV